MISTTMLDGLQDDELRSTRTLIDEILHKRDDERKARAIEDAKAVKAKALADARAVLAAAGLTLKALGGSVRRKSPKSPYLGGHTYQHPANKALVWNAKGQKPNWLRELEAQGKSAVEIPPARE